MFRFTIRDLLWLTVVSAFALCWLAERNERQRIADLSQRRVKAYRELEARHIEARRQLVEHARDAQRRLLEAQEEFRKELSSR